MSLTILRSASGKLATKRHCRDATGVITTHSYGSEKWWHSELVLIANFNRMVAQLACLLDEPTMLLVRGAPRSGVDLSQPILRRSNGEDATIEDAPSKILHLDVDSVAEASLDVVSRPDEARQHVLNLIEKAAPELKGAACWCSWSSSAGVYGVTKVKVHIWYCTARPYTCSELKLWGKAVNDRAGFKLVDLALFQPVQPNYVARPLFRNMPDPFPGPLRCKIIEGHAPILIVPTPSAIRQSVNDIRPSLHTGIGGSLDATIRSMGDGEGQSGFHIPWNRALAQFYGRHGPDADPRPLLIRLAARIKHGGRDAKYFRAELLGMIKRARALAAKERTKKGKLI